VTAREPVFPGDLLRIGQLYPSGGLCDDELQLMAPAGVQVHTTRLPFRKASLADDLRLADDIESHAGLLADAAVDILAFNCTAASAVIGADAINARILAATRIPSVTTIEAVIAALRAARLRRIALLTPYSKDVVRKEIDVLAANGVAVTTEGGRPFASPVEQGRLRPAVWFEWLRELSLDDADGLLISCAGVRLSPVLAELEQEIGRPVIASNQALLWMLLRRTNVEARSSGFGTLLAGVFDTA
jgi:maleate isomerase